MGVSVGVLDHFNIRTRKLADTVRFYRGYPGPGEGRPAELCLPGAWMYSEGKPVVHLVDISRPMSRKSRIPALSITSPSPASGFAGMKQRLGVQGDGIRRRDRFPAAISGRSSSMTPMAS